MTEQDIKNVVQCVHRRIQEQKNSERVFVGEIPLIIKGIGRCTARRYTVKHEYIQWEITYGETTVIGDYCYDNGLALKNAYDKFRKEFLLPRD